MSSQRKKVSTACLPCRKRKTRCDGLQPECRTCQTYGSNCVYNLERDSRKTPSKAYISALKNRIATLEDLLNEIVDAETTEAREGILLRIRQQRYQNQDTFDTIRRDGRPNEEVAARAEGIINTSESAEEEVDALEDMTSLVAHLHIDESGTVYSVGATSNLLEAKPRRKSVTGSSPGALTSQYISGGSPSAQLLPSFSDHPPQPVYLTPLEHHLLRLYFAWQHPIFHLFSEHRFMRDLQKGVGSCYSPLLLAALLALGSHYSDYVSAEQRDAYFARAKKLLEDELERPSLPTCRALVLMGTREAGCGRERGSGWLYAGMGFRMGIDLGIHLDPKKLHDQGYLSAEDVEERAFTFWGSFVSDRGWTAYLGRTESLPYRNVERDILMPERTTSNGCRAWSPYTDANFQDSDDLENLSGSVYECGSFKHLCQLVALLGSIVRNLYNKETAAGNRNGPSSEVVSDLHTKLCAWYNKLPHYMRLSPGASPIVLHAHMVYHTALILLFRPFVRTQRRQAPVSRGIPYEISPLATCTTSALTISRCLKQYQKAYTLRRYANWMVHPVLTASTIYVIHAAGTISKRDPLPNETCSPEEAARKLGETMRALAEMSAAWANAGRCLSQIQQWVEQYNIQVNSKLTAHLPQPNSSIDWNEPVSQYEYLPSTATDNPFTTSEYNADLFDMNFMSTDFDEWPTDLPDFTQSLDVDWNVT